jgi:hypothetical protein
MLIKAVGGSVDQSQEAGILAADLQLLICRRIQKSGYESKPLVASQRTLMVLQSIKSKI